MLLTFEHLPLRVVLLMARGDTLPATSAELARLHLLELDDMDTSSAALNAGALPPAPPALTPELDQVVPAREEHIMAAPATVQAAPWKLPAGVALATVLIGGLAWWSQQIGQPTALSPSRTPTGNVATDLASTTAGKATSTAANTFAGTGAEAATGTLPQDRQPETNTSVAQDSVAPTDRPALSGETGISTNSTTPPTATHDIATGTATGAEIQRATDTGPATARSVAADATSTTPVAAPQASQPAGIQGSRASATAGTAPVTGLREARQWLGSLPAESWLVEHSRHGSWRQARRSTGTQQHLREARILPVKDKGQTHYLVVTGPFRSVERAGNYQQRLQLKGRTHKTSHLRRQLAS